MVIQEIKQPDIATKKSTPIDAPTSGNSIHRHILKRSLSENSLDEVPLECVEQVNLLNGNTVELLTHRSAKKAQPIRKRRQHKKDEYIDNDYAFGVAEEKNNFFVKNARFSDAIDVVLRIIGVLIFIKLELMKSFERVIHMEEMWLYKNPRTPDIVSPTALLLSVILVPFGTTLLFLLLTNDRRDFRAASWVWTLILCFNGIITSTLKVNVGRPRPDFFYRCFPDGIPLFTNDTLYTVNCTGNAHVINEGLKSFPSGHASFSFASFGFVCFYVGGKLHAFNVRGRGETWRLCIAVTPLFIALLIAVSRVCDYHHHWQDVVVGGALGCLVAYLIYRQYYPSIFAYECNRPLSRRVRYHLLATSNNSNRYLQAHRTVNVVKNSNKLHSGDDSDSSMTNGNDDPKEYRPLIYKNKKLENNRWL